MKSYIVDFEFYDNREHLASAPDVRGNCFCPKVYGMWSFRLIPSTRRFQFLVQDGPWLDIDDRVELLWGLTAFGSIVVRSISEDI